MTVPFAVHLPHQVLSVAHAPCCSLCCPAYSAAGAGSVINLHETSDKALTCKLNINTTTGRISLSLPSLGAAMHEPKAKASKVRCDVPHVTCIATASTQRADVCCIKTGLHKLKSLSCSAVPCSLQGSSAA